MDKYSADASNKYENIDSNADRMTEELERMIAAFEQYEESVDQLISIYRES